MIWKVLALATAGFFAANVAIYESDRSKTSSVNAILTNPPITTIIVPVWYESEEFIETSLGSLRNQNIVQQFPEQFQFIAVGCNDGLDYKLVQKYANVLICAHKGKLNARVAGIQASRGEIIVACDSDRYYPPNWLNQVLQPFNDPQVLATETYIDHSLNNPVAPLFNVPIKKIWYDKKRLEGGGSAFRRSAYYQVGGFDTSAGDQSQRGSFPEEEFKFAERIAAVGKIKFVPAPSVNLGYTLEGRGIGAGN